MLELLGTSCLKNVQSSHHLQSILLLIFGSVGLIYAQPCATRARLLELEVLEVYALFSVQNNNLLKTVSKNCSTVVQVSPNPQFNPEAAANELRKAMKGLGQQTSRQSLNTFYTCTLVSITKIISTDWHLLEVIC